ncbi:MAG: hypothetical protein K0S07_807 [Chlamydiales bacterium]|jgi:hypothetical protein|nr:hypothetical protein [Chlamydiales bacterium]
MRFAKYSIRYSLLLALLGSALAYSILQVRPCDLEEYLALAEKSRPVRPEEVQGETKQKRFHVEKSLWLSQGDERLLMRIRARSSELSLKTNCGKTDFIEDLEDISCIMQESLHYFLPDGREGRSIRPGRLLFPSFKGLSEQIVDADAVEVSRQQSLRSFEAKRGLYDYKTMQLITDQVTLFRFIAPGHLLPENLHGLEPSMQGVADSIQMSLTQDRTDFKAKRLKMIFFSKRGFL